MRRLLFLLLPIVLLSSKCKEDIPPETQGTLALNIITVFNNTPLIINKVYDYNGKKVRFTKWGFFVGDFYGPRLLSGSLNRVTNPNIAFFDFTNLTDSLTALKGITKTGLSMIEMSDKFKMSIGVESPENAKKPKDFDSTSPLSDSGYYWDDWNSYIFSKLEGLMDKDGDGKFETGITLHTGGNEVFQTLSFTKNIIVNVGKTTTLNFDLNLNKLLNGIDLATVNSTHQTGDLPTMKLFMGNFKEALTIK